MNPRMPTRFPVSRGHAGTILPRASAASFLACLLLLAPACDSPLPPGATLDEAHQRVAALEGDTDAVERTIASLNTAFDMKDTERLASLFTETAEVYMYDGKVFTAAEFVAALPDVWASWSDMRTEYSLKGVKLARPYGWAKYVETFTATVNGRPLSMANLVTLTFERRGEAWLIGHMHLSTATPPSTGKPPPGT